MEGTKSSFDGEHRTPASISIRTMSYVSLSLYTRRNLHYVNGADMFLCRSVLVFCVPGYSRNGKRKDGPDSAKRIHILMRFTLPNYNILCKLWSLKRMYEYDCIL